MNWKSIAIHALLLLVASVAFGIFGPQPSSTAPKALLLSYVLTQCALHVVYAGVFAHLTLRAESHPLAHTLLALLLSHEAAAVLLAFGLAYMKVEPSVQLPPLLAFEYAMLLTSLSVGIAAGMRLRHRKVLQSKPTGSRAANA